MGMMFPKIDTDKLFKAYKVSVDGNQERWGYVYDLTGAEACNVKKFPLGIQTEKSSGRQFIWQTGIND